MSYVITAFILVYITTSLGLAKSVGLNAVLIGSAIHSATIPLWGTLSDKIGRRAVYLFGAVGMAAVLVAKETRGAALEADDVVAAVPRQAAEVTR